MKQLILICHNDHLVSGSNRFIKELFEPEFRVDIVPYDNGIHYISALIEIRPQAIYVLWQTEFLAPWITAKGCKTVVFPMYDGCSNSPDSYFKLLDNSYIFNFSKAIHDRCVRLGLVSYRVNYSPPPRPIENSSIEKKNQLFYWLRRPDSSLSESNIIDYFSSYLDGIHIHDRPDAYNLFTPPSRSSDNFTTTSNWFENKDKLAELIQSSKYYLAPRESEGIGMAFLEAMAMGSIVFANKNSTHDQYIYHGYNGFLIDFESRDNKRIHKQIKEAFKIIASGKPVSENAMEFISNNRSRWVKDSQKIKKMLVSLHESDARKPSRKVDLALGYLLARLYYKHPGLYLSFSHIAVKAATFSVFSKKERSFLNILISARRFIRRK